MLARCDGDKLGEIVVLQLSKQELIFGPMQINARINQDQNISKDLTLWGQQGSQVLQGQTLVLPVGDTFLYISPLYLAATQARMPQLKKVVLAVGNRLIYTDTYEEARAQLGGTGNETGPNASIMPPAAAAQALPCSQLKGGDPRIDSIRQHMQRYRDFAGQGKWSEAGRELEAIQNRGSALRFLRGAGGGCGRIRIFRGGASLDPRLPPPASHCRRYRRRGLLSAASVGPDCRLP